MIVNPQEFNYKVIIGILVSVMVAFAAYGISSYSILKSNADSLVQEKRHLHNELSEILNRYDALNSENLSLKSQLDSTTYKVGITETAIKHLEAKNAFNAIAKKELNLLKAQKSSLENREDSILQLMHQIDEEKHEALQELKAEKASKKAISIEKVALEKKMDEASHISANSFIAKAYKASHSHKISETFKAKDAEHIELSFVIDKNKLTPQGNKAIYVQIIGPDNNVVSDKGAVNFGDDSLIFSQKANVDYANEALEVSFTIPNEEPFKTGLYYINVFEGNRPLGGTKIELN